MKAGDFFHRDEAIKDGYHFSTYFAYCMVYVKDRTYVFVDIKTQIIKTILTS